MTRRVRHPWARALVIAEGALRCAALGGSLWGCPQLLEDRFDAGVSPDGGAAKGNGAGGAPAVGGAPSNAGSAALPQGGSGGSGGSGGATTGAGGSGGSAGSAGVGGATAAGGWGGSAGHGGGSGGASSAARCASSTFSTPELLSGLGRAGALYGPSLSGNGLMLAFAESVDDGPEDIFIARRDAPGGAFGLAMAAAGINTAASEGTAFLSEDARAVYFYSDRAGGAGGRDIYRATRSDVDADFGGVHPVEGVNGGADDHMPWLAPDGLSLYFASTRAAGEDGSNIWYTKRSGPFDGFEPPVELEGINGDERDASPTLSADQSILVFCSDRHGGAGGDDIWMATREDANGPFGAPEPVTSVNHAASELNVALSRDGRELIFSSNRDGSRRLYRSVRDCPD